MPTNLAIEHLQPKGIAKYSHLEEKWDNFLLACVNCNSAKSDKDVDFAQLFFPDRDNTFAAFIYLPDGQITANPGLLPGLVQIAERTIELTALNKQVADAHDENGKLVALDRFSQRMELWLLAQSALDDWKSGANDTLKRMIVRLAVHSGGFSIWMHTFANEPTVLPDLIDAFPGTAASNCFNAVGATVSPHPNADLLAGGGKL